MLIYGLGVSFENEVAGLGFEFLFHCHSDNHSSKYGDHDDEEPNPNVEYVDVLHTGFASDSGKQEDELDNNKKGQTDTKSQKDEAQEDSTVDADNSPVRESECHDGAEVLEIDLKWASIRNQRNMATKRTLIIMMAAQRTLARMLKVLKLFLASI